MEPIRSIIMHNLKQHFTEAQDILAKFIADDKNFEAIKIIKFRPLLLIKENASPLTEDHCGICLEDHLTSTATWCKLIACRHKFHTKCFMLCHKGSDIKKCPLCRTDYFISEKID